VSERKLIAVHRHWKREGELIAEVISGEVCAAERPHSKELFIDYALYCEAMEQIDILELALNANPRDSTFINKILEDLKKWKNRVK